VSRSDYVVSSRSRGGTESDPLHEPDTINLGKQTGS